MDQYLIPLRLKKNGHMSSKKKSLKKKEKGKTIMNVFIANLNCDLHFFKKIIIESLFYDCMTKCLKRKNKFDDTK